MRDYHDKEWGVPQRDGRMLWEMLMLEGFQAGLAWIIVLRKREAFREAFAGFDPARVARFGEKDIARLMADPGIIRARNGDFGERWRTRFHRRTGLVRHSWKYAKVRGRFPYNFRTST